MSEFEQWAQSTTIDQSKQVCDEYIAASIDEVEWLHGAILHKKLAIKAGIPDPKFSYWEIFQKSNDGKGIHYIFAIIKANDE